MRYKTTVLKIFFGIFSLLIGQFTFFRIPAIYNLCLSADLYDHAKWVEGKPKVVLMGSSHCYHGIDPKVIAQQNLLDENSVVNLGISAGTPFEMLVTYNKNLEKLKNAKILYYTIEPWVFYEKYYKHKAYEKIFIDMKQYFSFILKDGSDYSYFFPSKLFLRALLSHGKGGSNQGFSPIQTQENHHFDEMTVDKLNEAFGSQSSGFGISRFQLESLQNLKNQAESNGTIVCFLLTPTDNSWISSYKKLHEYDLEFTKELNKHLGPVRVVGSFSPERFGLLKKDFYDDNHLALSGAKKYTQQLFENISGHVKLSPQKIVSLILY